MNFIDKYNNKKNVRFPFFKKTLEIAHKRNIKIIVETGTARGKTKFFFFKKINWKDGMSTLLFADFAKYVDGELHSCDLSKNNIENAKHFTKDYSSFTSFYIDDSINFLKSFPKKIDLLYLDSLDGHDSKLASSHQLEEAKMSFNKLHDNSLVLLDDKGAKTLLSLDFYLKNDFKILEESFNQVLLSKRL